jgi:hypothetical protein
VEQKHVGIGGWLTLPALGLLFTPIIEVRIFIQSLAPVFTRHGWIPVLNLAYALLVLALLIYAAIRFFSKKRNAPVIMIVLMVAPLVIDAVSLLTALGYGADPFVIVPVRTLAGSLLGAAIWVPYFCVSKRVKATFVK